MIARKRHVALAAVLASLLLAVPAGADFGLHDIEASFSEADGSPAAQAGSHPYEMKVAFALNTTEGGKGWQLIEGAIQDLEVFQPEGFAGDPNAVPRCATLDFLTFLAVNETKTACPDSSALGYLTVTLGNGEVAEPAPIGPVPVFNLNPSPGSAAKLGFWVGGVPITVDVTLDDAPPYRIVGTLTNTNQFIEVQASALTLWGTPADPSHDPFRGRCLEPTGGGEPASSGDCAANVPVRPFITMPRSCEKPLITTFRALSWWSGDPANPDPAALFEENVPAKGELGEPLTPGGCSKLSYAPEFSAQPTSDSVETGAGLELAVEFPDEGLANPKGLANSDTKKAEVAFPPGVTINPSAAEGLEVCTPAHLARETVNSLPGEGCPEASKLGSLRAVSPLVEEAVEGSIYLAAQDDPVTAKPGAENPFDSLIAVYFVLRNANLGVIVKLPVLIEPDPENGQLVATLDDIPQIPLTRFEAQLRSGARAPLITPAACGTYETEARFTPWADPASPLTTTASFNIVSGVGGGPCPQGGVPPFSPRFDAGSRNNHAGTFSPFDMRLQRADGEQDMTRFSSILPPGVLGSLAGVGKCPDSALALARSKTGRQELATPSCPASSEIGRTLAGAGVGEALTYVGGKVYLAGPYKGRPLSVIAITPGVAGPFDAGTVALRLALTLNPRTAEVEVDGAASDPIPHILQGIVLKVRDLRVHVDRPKFTLNPTSCDPSAARAALFGSFLDVIDPSDDVPVSLSARYQAAGCAGLGFKPKLLLRLMGGTKRGAHPALRATYRPRPGDANLEGLVLRLPRSAFLDQGHIRTICTRVQFAAEACPRAAQYGYIKAWTPLLEEPLQGRSTCAPRTTSCPTSYLT